MLQEIRVCDRAELASAQRIARWIEEWRDEVVAFHNDGNTLIISGICPHFGGELDLHGRALRCRWHRWEFDAQTGVCNTYPIAGRVRHFPFEWRDDNLIVFPNADS